MKDKQINKNQITLPYIDDFLLYLKTSNYSEKTIYNYERDLVALAYFLQEIDIKFEEITKNTLLNYKAYLTSRDRKTPKSIISQKQLSSYSINRMLSVLRSYLKFLIDLDYEVPVEPTTIKLIKTEKKHPRVSEFEKIVKLIEAPSKIEKNNKVALRNRAVLETLFATGMRISELVNLKKSQIDKTGRIFIMGKGKKERFVYLTPRAHEHLINYLETRRNDNLPYLFIPYSGKNVQDKNKKISTNYLQEKIKKYRELLGINIPISAHSLRHGFATYLAEEGASPAAIQTLLGHESLNTTTRYINTSDKFAEKVHREFHPLKK
ncbi:tyrosine-type recombinase/integrase [Patescibacteria group bacterium]|nr:tyrosine-type recombinase/integrase [Patescibacteria group bacterium]MBU2472559.1 tyrosine-type recombinase/integrase [Patescibacteria group bacterium]